MRKPAIAADDITMNDEDSMEMVRHDHMILHLYHRIMGGDGRRQFLLYHSAYIRKGDARRLRVVVGLGDISDDSTKQRT